MADANLFMKQMQAAQAAKKKSLSLTTGTMANPYAAALAQRASVPPMSGYSVNKVAMAQAQAEVAKLKGNDGLITTLRREQMPTVRPTGRMLPTLASNTGNTMMASAAADHIADNFDAAANEARRHADLAKTAKNRGDFRSALEHLANAARAAVKTHAMGRQLVDYKEKIARSKIVNSYMEQARLARAQGNNGAAQALAVTAKKVSASSLLPPLPAALKRPPLQSDALLQKYSHQYVRNGRQEGYVLAARGGLNGLNEIESMADSLKFSATKIQTATRSAIGYLNRASSLSGLGFSTGIPIIDNNVNAASNVVNQTVDAGKKFLSPYVSQACDSAAASARAAAMSAASSQLQKTGADPNSANFKNAVKAAGDNAYNGALQACKQATGVKSPRIPGTTTAPTVAASAPQFGTGGIVLLAGAAAAVAFKFFL